MVAQIGSIEIVLAGDANEREQGIAAGIGQRRPCAACLPYRRSGRPAKAWAGPTYARSSLLLLGATAAAAVLAAHPALSADLGPIAPTYKAAPVVPPTPFFTWTGCYVGAHVGGGLARKTFTTPPVTFAAPPPINSTLTSDAREFSFDPSGFVGGGQFGCNYQFAQEWAVGVEANIEGADIQGSKIDTHSDIDTSNPALITTNTFGLGVHSKSPWLASATARIGWAPGPWFIYVKGGGAWIRTSTPPICRSPRRSRQQRRPRRLRRWLRGRRMRPALAGYWRWYRIRLPDLLVGKVRLRLLLFRKPESHLHRIKFAGGELQGMDERIHLRH
jgi:hypothetical protein